MKWLYRFLDWINCQHPLKTGAYLYYVDADGNDVDDGEFYSLQCYNCGRYLEGEEGDVNC